MQDAANASTAFGRIRSFESILESIDQAPGDVKPMAKKLPKKKKQKGCPKKLHHVMLKALVPKLPQNLMLQKPA